MSDNQGLFTRKEYMSTILVDRELAARLHRKYYAQFVNDRVIVRVVWTVGKENIMNSTDAHFNDVPMGLWDEAGKTAKPFAIKFADVGDFPSDAGLVCVVKEAARQYVEMEEATTPEVSK